MISTDTICRTRVLAYPMAYTIPTHRKHFCHPTRLYLQNWSNWTKGTQTAQKGKRVFLQATWEYELEQRNLVIPVPHHLILQHGELKAESCGKYNDIHVFHQRAISKFNIIVGESPDVRLHLDAATHYSGWKFVVYRKYIFENSAKGVHAWLKLLNVLVHRKVTHTCVVVSRPPIFKQRLCWYQLCCYHRAKCLWCILLYFISFFIWHASSLLLAWNYILLYSSTCTDYIFTLIHTWPSHEWQTPFSNTCSHFI